MERGERDGEKERKRERERARESARASASERARGVACAETMAPIICVHFWFTVCPRARSAVVTASASGASGPGWTSGMGTVLVCTSHICVIGRTRFVAEIGKWRVRHPPCVGSVRVCSEKLPVALMWSALGVQGLPRLAAVGLGLVKPKPGLPRARQRGGLAVGLGPVPRGKRPLARPLRLGLELEPLQRLQRGLEHPRRQVRLHLALLQVRCTHKYLHSNAIQLTL